MTVGVLLDFTYRHFFICNIKWKSVDKPTFSETVPNELKELGYIPPIIKPYNKDGVCVKLGEIFDSPIWRLYVDGIPCMALDLKHLQATQFYSHYKLARGHVICTGLGFGIREQWLATKPEVTKVTVLEKFKEVIDYHKNIGTKWSDKIEIINCDANDYKGSCDFLSIDHYEYDDVLRILDSIKKVCNNITCECAWFWMLEQWISHGIIIDDHHPNTALHYGGKRHNNIYENYIKIKKYFDIDKLPSLDEAELMKFINMYYGRFYESNTRI